MTEILHNRIRWLLAALMLLLTSGGISAATETVTRLYDGTLLTKTVRTVDGVQYTHLSWLGLDATRMPGAPEMPVEYIRFLVPVYTNNFRVTVTAGGLSRQTLGARVFPSQEPVLASYEGPVEFTAPNPQYYSATQPIRAEYIEDGFVDGCNHIVTVAVYPASYDDATLSVTTASTVTVTLEYDSCTATELESTPIFPPRASKYLDLKSMVINGERTANRLYAPREKASPDAPEYYYIITPRNLEEAFQDLAIWKRQKGYNVIVKCIEDVYADPRYRIGAMYSLKNEAPQQVVDSAMSLRCYLKDQYQLNGHFFCLLAGDWRTPMPIRKATPCDSIIHRDKNKNPIDTTYLTDNCSQVIPTDIYFSNLSDGFQLVKRSHMTIKSVEQYSIKFNPDIAIGRLLCATPKEVSNYFYKLRLYESNPGYGDNDYLAKGLFFESCGRYWDADSAKFLPSGCMIGESKELRANATFLSSYILYQDEYHASFDKRKWVDSLETERTVSEEFDGPTGPEIIRALSEVGFSSWHAHGEPTSVAVGVNGHNIYANDSLRNFHLWSPQNYKCESGSGLDKVSNFTKPAFAYSISCTTAPSDAYTTGAQQPPYYHVFTETNMGRAWTTDGKNGGPGTIMNSRSGWVGSSAKVELEWMKQVKNMPKVGEALRQCELYYDKNYLDKDGSNWYTNELAPLYLIGEPEFEMWLGKPDTFQIELVPSVSGIKISGNVPDSVHLIAHNGDLSKTIRTYAQAETSINSFTNGEFCISIWKQKYLPIIALIGQNGHLDIYKKYIVRNAILGRSSLDLPATQVYTVNNGGKLQVDATDNISTYAGFVIENGGEVTLHCDGEVNLNGVHVKSGGKLTVIARKVTMGKDFRVDQRGKFSILNR